jgi:hypothetical protein
MDNELKNSEDFISRVASEEASFSVPSNYFNSVEDTFSAKLSEETLPNNHGFGVTDTYFNELEDVILSKVTKQPKVISLRRRIIKMIPATAAASVALFIALNFFTIEKEVTAQEIENWFDNDIYRISSDDITLAFEDIDLSDEEVDTSINIDDIENYLENIDTTTLLNEIN